MHLTNKEILDKPFELLLPYLDISFSSPTTVDKELKKRKSHPNGQLFYYGSIISVVGKTTVEIIELFECTQKVP